jgi:eukaryotic-like serine/threonine-protein kinase
MDDPALDAPADLRLLAGRYRLCAVMGRGGMGTVWHARDELLNRDVAVKEVTWPPYLSEAEQRAVRDRALGEARLAARLRHPNIVGIYDVVEEDGRPWIVMELFRYRSLRDVMREDGPLPPARAARLGLGVLAALRAAHAEGIVHRDVKPANILVSPEDRAVLTDFGIARTADSCPLTSDRLAGSPSYIAPERAWGEQAGPAADLWALGAALYAAVEGRAPFQRKDALASLTAAVTDEPAPALHAGPLWPVISGLLRKDPDSRPCLTDAERMLRQAARDCEALGVAGPGAGAPPRSPVAPGASRGWPPWRSRRGAGALAATVAMTGAAAAAFALPLGGSPVERAGALAGPPPSAQPSSGHASPGRASAPSSGKPTLSRAASSPVVAAAISYRPPAKGNGRGARDEKSPPGQDRAADSADRPASGPPGWLTSTHAQPGKQRHRRPH